MNDRVLRAGGSSARRWAGFSEFAGLAGLLASLLLFGCRPAAPRPNILFILIDTLRADVVAANAPNLEELGRNGVRFDRVIAPSSWTKTSMASILSSQTPLRHGVRTTEDTLPDKLVTLAKGLAAAGYRTLGVNANPWLTESFGFHGGFEQYQSHPLANAAELNAIALKLVTKASERPEFLYLHYMDVHAPYSPSSEYFHEPPLHIRGRGAMPDAQVEIAYRKSGLHTPKTVQRVRALYEAEVRELDEAIAQLLQGLRAEGFLENALIVVTSDHGEAFLEHGTTVHGKNYYPEVYRVPLLMTWPDHIPGGLRIDSQVRSIDIVPTLFDFLALAIPASFEGLSLLPLDRAPAQDRVALGAVGLNDYRPEQDYVGVVSRDYLYLVERRSGDEEFYDLRVDPGAQHNLGTDRAEAQRHARYIEAAVSAARAAGAAESPAGDRPGKVELDADTREQLRELGYLPGDD